PNLLIHGHSAGLGFIDRLADGVLDGFRNRLGDHDGVVLLDRLHDRLTYVHGVGALTLFGGVLGDHDLAGFRIPLRNHDSLLDVGRTTRSGTTTTIARSTRGTIAGAARGTAASGLGILGSAQYGGDTECQGTQNWRFH